MEKGVLTVLPKEAVKREQDTIPSFNRKLPHSFAAYFRSSTSITMSEEYDRAVEQVGEFIDKGMTQGSFYYEGTRFKFTSENTMRMQLMAVFSFGKI